MRLRFTVRSIGSRMPCVRACSCVVRDHHTHSTLPPPPHASIRARALTPRQRPLSSLPSPSLPFSSRRFASYGFIPFLPSQLAMVTFKKSKAKQIRHRAKVMARAEVPHHVNYKFGGPKGEGSKNFTQPW